jgi:hypothetical protein
MENSDNVFSPESEGERTGSDHLAEKKERLETIAYAIWSHINEYDLSIGEADHVVDYIAKRIHPFQSNRSLRERGRVPYRVVIPETACLTPGVSL